jgi:hypothetical protein
VHSVEQAYALATGTNTSSPHPLHLFYQCLLLLVFCVCFVDDPPQLWPPSRATVCTRRWR